MALDVLEHDDGVVDHEAHGDGQRHQGQVVQAVAERVHHAEGADERHGQGDARDQGRAQVAQEGEDHQDDQDDGQDQGELDVGERGPDGLGPVAQDLDADRGGNGRLELRQGGLDPVHGLDDVGARLLEDGQE